MTSENDNIVATALSTKKAFESQIITLENKVSIMNDQKLLTYLFPQKVEVSTCTWASFWSAVGFTVSLIASCSAFA